MVGRDSRSAVDLERDFERNTGRTPPRATRASESHAGHRSVGRI